MASISIHPDERPWRSEAYTSKGTSWIQFCNGTETIVFFFDDPADLSKAEALRDAFLHLFAPMGLAFESDAA